MGRTLLRMLCSHISDRPPAAWTLTTIEPGIIRLQCDTDTAPLWGNISHSGNFVCATVSANGPIGLDVEYVDRTRDMAVLLRSVTGHHDQQLPETPEGQYRLWTLFEAYCKATSGILEFPIPDQLLTLAQLPFQGPAFLFLNERHIVLRSLQIGDYSISVCQAL